MLYLSLIQANQEVQGSLLYVSAGKKGEIASKQFAVKGIIDSKIMTLTLSPSGVILQGRREGSELLIDFTSSGEITTVLFTQTDANTYSEIVSTWKHEHRMEHERQEAIASKRSAMDKTIQRIKESELPTVTEKLQKSFYELEGAVNAIREVGKSVIKSAENSAVSCNEVYGQLKATFYDSLHHEIYHGPFSDSSRDYRRASQEIISRVENGQKALKQLPAEHQAWLNSLKEAGLTPKEPSLNDIESIISNHHKIIERATTARETLKQKAESLHAEGEKIYQQARRSYERAERTCQRNE